MLLQLLMVVYLTVPEGHRGVVSKCMAAKNPCLLPLSALHYRVKPLCENVCADRPGIAPHALMRGDSIDSAATGMGDLQCPRNVAFRPLNEERLPARSETRDLSFTILEKYSTNMNVQVSR